MSYVDKNLLKDEKVIIKAKISIWYIIPDILGTIVAFLMIRSLKGYLNSFSDAEDLQIVTNGFFNIIFGICLIGLIRKILIMLTTHLAITNKRVIGKYGILSIKTMDIKIEKVDNISFSAKFLGMLFHYYRITIRSASGVYHFKAISNAQQFKNTVTESIENHEKDLQETQAKAIADAIKSKDVAFAKNADVKAPTSTPED